MGARAKPGHDEWCAAYWFTSGDHAHDVALLHDQEFLAIELDLGARPFAEQHAIADLEVDRDQLAGFVAAARADRRDFALRGVFLGAVGNDDATLGLFFGVDALDHDSVMQWTKIGFSHRGSFWRVGFSGRVCQRKWIGRTSVFDTAKGDKTARILSNRALGVLIVCPGIWLDADPVKQRGLRPW